VNFDLNFDFKAVAYRRVPVFQEETNFYSLPLTWHFSS